MILDWRFNAMEINFNMGLIGIFFYFCVLSRGQSPLKGTVPGKSSPKLKGRSVEVFLFSRTLALGEVK